MSDLKRRELSARSELANATRTQERLPERLVLARQAYNAVKIEQAIDRYAPQVTDEERVRLAAMLTER